MIKIGYQGIEGSNAEQAAHDLVEKLKLTDVEYVPLVDSQHVIRAMKTGARSAVGCHPPPWP